MGIPERGQRCREFFFLAKERNDFQLGIASFEVQFFEYAFFYLPGPMFITLQLILLLTKKQTNTLNNTQGVIKGWDQGCLGMKIGEQRKLTIPGHEGYGAGGFPAWG